jgi:hypothetical protein
MPTAGVWSGNAAPPDRKFELAENHIGAKKERIDGVRKIKDFQILKIDDFSDNEERRSITNVLVAKIRRATR